MRRGSGYGRARSRPLTPKWGFGPRDDMEGGGRLSPTWVRLIVPDVIPRRIIAFYVIPRNGHKRVHGQPGCQGRGIWRAEGARSQPLLRQIPPLGR